MLDLTKIIAAAAVCLALYAMHLRGNNATLSGRVNTLEAEAHGREIAESALKAGRKFIGAGRGEVATIYQNTIREVALAPTNEACLRDPALLLAYDGAERMRDAHESAIRDAAGGSYEALLGPDSLAQSGD